MALLDAWALGQSVAYGRRGEQIDWSVVWQHYHRLRGSSTLFYQSMSRLLTPLYQSDHWWTGVLRDVAFTWMYRVPYLRREMAVTISGLKTGMLSQMQYAQIATR
jgi:2-polyprenyl-6-methoxyphenol hydroxylase-like FAD-dependent oxidoreductase